MRKVKRWRPEVEPLESLALLSGVVGEVHHHAAALVRRARIPLPNPLPLAGAANGTFQLRGATAPARINGSGTLGVIGRVNLSGRVNVTQGTNGGGVLNASNRQGKLTLALGTPTMSGTLGFTAPFTIVGGTRAFAGETGSGLLTATLRPTGAGRGNFRATFS